MAVEVSVGQSVEVGAPRPLFAAPVDTSPFRRNRYVAASDGQRFLLVAPTGSREISPTTVVVNWLAGTGRR